MPEPEDISYIAPPDLTVDQPEPEAMDTRGDAMPEPEDISYTAPPDLTVDQPEPEAMDTEPAPLNTTVIVAAPAVGITRPNIPVDLPVDPVEPLVYWIVIYRKSKNRAYDNMTTMSADDLAPQIARTSVGMV